MSEANCVILLSPTAVLTLANGMKLMVLNNIEAGRHRLVMVMQEPQSQRWQVIQVIEDDASLVNGLRREFSYPFLISSNGDDAHLTYTWDRKKIKHIYFPAAWFKYSVSSLKEKESQR
jgi:predicted neuraminidase